MTNLTGLRGYSYLHKRRILTLVFILTAASALFSMTAFSLLGFYRGFNAYLGEGEDIIAVYARNSRTPFTGSVPAYLAGVLNSMEGVSASSPETIALCMVQDEPVFLRGIIPDQFAKLTRLTVPDGDNLQLDDLNSIVAGIRAAEKLNLETGDTVLVFSALRDTYLELRVKGTYRSDSPLDDELLAPLYVGQWLGGTGYGRVTLIRLKIDRDTVTAQEIIQKVAEEAAEPAPDGEENPESPLSSLLPRRTVRFAAETLGVEGAERFMKSYLDRYGVSREALLVLSVVVFLASSLSVTTASKTVLTQHKREIHVLRSIGASLKTVKIDLLLKLLPWAALSSAFGVLLATFTLDVIQEAGYLQVLSHTVPFTVNPVILVLDFILVLALTSISIIRGELG